MLETSSTETIILDARAFFDIADRLLSSHVPKGWTLMMDEGVFRSESASLEETLGGGERLLVNIELTRVETDAEAVTTITLATQLSDADAKTVALSLHRDYAICTDDPKLRAVIVSVGASKRIYSTRELMKKIAR